MSRLKYLVGFLVGVREGNVETSEHKYRGRRARRVEISCYTTVNDPWSCGLSHDTSLRLVAVKGGFKIE